MDMTFRLHVDNNSTEARARVNSDSKKDKLHFRPIFSEAHPAW